MSYEQLLTKIADADLPINGHLMEIIHRVKVAGLHNVAGKLHGIEDFNIKTASQHLGTQLLRTHFKYQKIAQGLAQYPGPGGVQQKEAGLGDVLRRITQRAGAGAKAGSGAGAEAGSVARTTFSRPPGVTPPKAYTSKEVANYHPVFDYEIKPTVDAYRANQATATRAAAGIQADAANRLSLAPPSSIRPVK